MMDDRKSGLLGSLGSITMFRDRSTWKSSRDMDAGGRAVSEGGEGREEVRKRDSKRSVRSKRMQKGKEARGD
jgi:hypothetical protein